MPLDPLGTCVVRSCFAGSMMMVRTIKSKYISFYVLRDIDATLNIPKKSEIAGEAEKQNEIAQTQLQKYEEFV